MSLVLLGNIALFLVSLIVVMRSAEKGTQYATTLAQSFQLSKYTVGFLIVAIISILPETFIALNAAVSGIPEFGLGTLLGSNVADLTLVFAITAFVAGRGLKIESRILDHHRAYPWILLVPLVLGLDAHFSRLDGLALIVVGAIFYYLAFQGGKGEAHTTVSREGVLSASLLLIVAMAALLTGAHFTVTSATAIAEFFAVSPVLIGMLVVGLGTTIPELFFSIKSTKTCDDSLAVGDVLGTVLADATIVIGILALVSPFSFPPTLIYIAGAFMVTAAFVLFNLMRSGRILTRKESLVLVALWLLFVTVQFIVSSE